MKTPGTTVKTLSITLHTANCTTLQFTPQGWLTIFAALHVALNCARREPRIKYHLKFHLNKFGRWWICALLKQLSKDLLPASWKYWGGTFQLGAPGFTDWKILSFDHFGLVWSGLSTVYCRAVWGHLKKKWYILRYFGTFWDILVGFGMF